MALYNLMFLFFIRYKMSQRISSPNKLVQKLNKILNTGVPGWLSGLRPLPLAHVMVSGSWDGALHRAPLLSRDLLPPLSLPASLTTCDLPVK